MTDNVVAYAKFQVSIHNLLPTGKTPADLEQILYDIIAVVFPPEMTGDLEVELQESTPLT